MNFYFFDVFSDKDVDDTSMWVGRWFVMLPLRKPGPGFFDGIYALPEFQPIYDFETDEFSFWVGPEIGKMLSPKHVVYVKPGWGVKPESLSGIANSHSRSAGATSCKIGSTNLAQRQLQLAWRACCVFAPPASS